MPEKVIQRLRNGVDLAGDFYDSSSTDGILLFPGIIQHRSSLGSLAEYLNSDFKTWTFDINSQGESTGTWDLNEISNSIYLLIGKLKKRYGLKKVGVVGNSAGGMSAGLAAAAMNSNISSLCFTNTPAGLQDIFPNYALETLGKIPQIIFRSFTLAYDKLECVINTNYKEKTHVQFKKNEAYQKYAQIGALKIEKVKEFVSLIRTAPRLDNYISKITQPSLFIYGGEDSLIGIKNERLPEEILSMYSQLKSEYKKVLIVPGANHNLNVRTRMDDCVNQDVKYHYVREEILDHFFNHM